MIRFCVSCRSRKNTAHLVPFYQQSGKLYLGQGTRSAWACATHSCLTTLERHPQKASRSLRKNIIDANKCITQVQNLVKRQIYKNIKHAQRSGSVYSGHKQIICHQNQIYILLLAHTSIQQQNFWKEQLPNCNFFILDISQKELGSLIQKSPKSALGILRNRHAQQLLEHLQQYSQLC